MVLDEYTLAIFSIIIGALLKIYDDINDNKLFKYNKYLKKYKKYINEFLKLSISGLFTIISFNNFIFCYLFTILNVLYSFIDIPAFNNPYEYSGLIYSCILFIYLCFINEINIIYLFFILIFYLFNIFIYYLFDIFLLHNIEFGIKKLIFRFIFAIYFLILYYFKFDFLYLSNNIILCWVSYLFTSCIFQIFLICNDKKDKKCKKDKKRKR